MNMWKSIVLISLGFFITSCNFTKKTTDEIFVGLWKCTSIVGTNENGEDLGVNDLISKCNGFLTKIENTNEGYYFTLCNDRYTLAKVNDSTLSGYGMTLIYNDNTKKLTAKTSTYIAIADKKDFWVYEFYKQK